MIISNDKYSTKREKNKTNIHINQPKQDIKSDKSDARKQKPPTISYNVSGF